MWMFTSRSKNKEKQEDIWLKGFEAGFNKAWEWMKPYMQDASDRVRKQIYEEAMNQDIQKRLNLLKEYSNGN